MYQARTQGIEVAVEPSFLPDQSSPDENYFVWAYHVRIANVSNRTVQLRSRKWRITDALGRVQIVEGAGVVGQQPVLKPGERFEYTSGAPLATATGFMAGTYVMETVDGETFEAEIPAFSLDSPFQIRALN